MSALLADRPAPKTFAPDQAFAPLSRARFDERRLSLMTPVVAGSLMAVMMLVPVICPPPPPCGVVIFVPSGKIEAVARAADFDVARHLELASA